MIYFLSKCQKGLQKSLDNGTLWPMHDGKSLWDPNVNILWNE